MEVDPKRVSCRGCCWRDMESVTFVVESCRVAWTTHFAGRIYVAALVYNVALLDRSFKLLGPGLQPRCRVRAFAPYTEAVARDGLPSWFMYSAGTSRVLVGLFAKGRRAQTQPRYGQSAAAEVGVFHCFSLDRSQPAAEPGLRAHCQDVAAVAHPHRAGSTDVGRDHLLTGVGGPVEAS